MAKKLFILISCVLISALCRATYKNHSPLPDNFVFDTHDDMNQYNKYVIPCINWLQQTPLNENKEEWAKVDDFVLHWLQINPDIDLSMPDYSLKFHGINSVFLHLFLEGWIKYTLETKDTNVTACSIAGLRSMLDYYKTGKASIAGRNDYLENLSKIDKEGKLASLFDTGHNAKNTFIFLTEPYSRHSFKHDENYFDFRFYCINMLTARGIQYRYMLEGYYDKWITTTDGSVTFPRLPPGNYNFRVQASMFPDFDNAAESGYSFDIARPLWKENWFLTCASLAAFALVYLFIRQREKSVKNIALLKHERIMFEYEHLKSQVNPHFLFNSLNTLTNLIAKDQDKAMEYTEKLSELYHSLLTYHENDFVLLAEEITILDNYISIQKGRFGDSLQMKVEIPDKVLRTKKIVPLALQILIENVIKHNVILASEPLVITVTADEEQIIIRNPVRPKLSKEKGEGLGLINIKRRYELLTKRVVTYGIRENEYIVILPLL